MKIFRCCLPSLACLVLSGCAAPPETPKPAAKAALPPASASAPKSAAHAPAAAPAKPAAAAAPAKPAPLDLKSLEQRLKDTHAIGVMTKLSLKNQVDDLVARFRAFHGGSRPPTLAELRPSFDLLVMKVLALLQDHDQALASDIHASRDALWGLLSDRQKFSQLQ